MVHCLVILVIIEKQQRRIRKKWLHLDLNKTSPFQCALDISDWLIKNNIRVLTVSGSKITDAPSIEKTVRKIFEAVWKIINEKESSAA